MSAGRSDARRTHDHHAECEDSVATSDRVEAWGTTEDGDEWRVHLTR